MTTTTSSYIESLQAHVAQELRTPVSPEIEWLAHEIAAIYGETVLGVMFYGSSLRADSADGVFDFWVVVDDYRDAYAKNWLARINQIIPPNVFYIEREHQGQTLRSKYGVISRQAFETGTSFAAWHPYVWARFAQPARTVACRDEAAQQVLVAAVANAILTMIGRLVCILPERDDEFRFSLAAFWQEAFRRIYDSERRPQSDEIISALYSVDQERYNAVASFALQQLASDGHFAKAAPQARSFRVAMSKSGRRQSRLRWRVMRSFARSLRLIRLAKTAITIQDWVPYVLWKIERHTGRRIELSERQQRHPWIFAWPIILPLLFRRNLRSFEE
ncbi:MAG: hypothetical protein ABGX04_04820 [Myxococcales bacterium]|nr:hypothetical protein [Myxococcales bacterium]HIK83738.1 hypothetical protein [Myxococcales bacterium]